jgi:hypothetical protein
MIKIILCVAMLVVSGSAVHAPNVFADDQKYELKSAAATVKDVLSGNINKRVIVRMDTGDLLEGTVSKVGDSLVHISKISGRDFYDAVVRMDKISAVLFKVRSN